MRRACSTARTPLRVWTLWIKLVDPERHDPLLEQMMSEAYAEIGQTQAESVKAPTLRKANLTPAPDIPLPPFYGTRTIESMPLEMVLQDVHKNELFRLSWGAKNTHGAEWDVLQADFEARLDRMSREALRDKSLLPQAVYGFSRPIRMATT